MPVSPTSNLLLLAASGVAAFRARSSDGDFGDRLALYTFGCPKVSSRPLTFKGGKCIPGLRVEAEDVKTEERDIVPWLQFAAHPKQTVLTLRENNSIERPCGWKRKDDFKPSIPLHNRDVYIPWSVKQGGLVAEIADVAFGASYEKDIADNMTGKGWELAGTANWFEEVSHLIQHPDSLECILTFEGSDSAIDWLNNVQLKRVSFCGMSGIHEGFTKSLKRILNCPSWQNNIKPHLGKCSKLNVMGHSLGGAMATLFSVCAQRQPKFNFDYYRQQFDWEAQARISES
jgi:hypothetical protein